jgi:HD-like signal output (HDOD) protein
MSTVVQKARSQIGPFFVLRTLEQAAGKAVHLATDTRNGRRVVLKTRESTDAAADLAMAEALRGFQHPNVVALHDAGEEGGHPYFAYEQVKGEPLSGVLAQRGPFEIGRAVDAALGLAQAVAGVHERGAAHGEITSASVLVVPDAPVRLLDLGYPRAATAGDAAQPAAADVRDLARLLYEMLTGVVPPAIDPARTSRARPGADIVPPSRHNAKVDERLDALVLRALAASPATRFTGAAEFAEALADYLDPQRPGEAGDDAPARGHQGTLDYLLRRIRHKGDFPALSATISAVNRAATSDREPVSVLCNSILKDFALTSRLLKIVNGSHLNQFGGAISTVSRAVSILGYDAVRNVSMSLVLFEHMHDRANAAALKDQVVSIYFSGLLARELHRRAGLHDGEQAFVCAMFHRLGKLLASFYLYEEARIVERHLQTQGWTEEQASREVLGLSYEELGIGVARAWNFPAEILESMRAVSGPVKQRPDVDSEKLRVISAMANDLSEVIRDGDAAQRSERLARIVECYGGATGVTEQALIAAVRDSADVLSRDADVLGHGVARSGFLRNANAWKPAGSAAVKAAGSASAAGARTEAAAGVRERRAGEAAAAAGEAAAASAGSSADAAMEPVAAETRSLVAGSRLESEPEPDAAPATAPGEPGQRHAALSAGIQEITNTLVGEHSLNDVLRVILETMYRAIGFRRVLLFVLDPRAQVLRCRLGFGDDAETIIQGRVAAPLHGGRDLFYAAVVMGADLCIEDIESGKVRQHVPQWYREAIGARGIVLLPIVSRKRTLGLIYADSDEPAVLRFSAEELGLLKTLRNQALLAMRQSS